MGGTSAGRLRASLQVGRLGGQCSARSLEAASRWAGWLGGRRRGERCRASLRQGRRRRTRGPLASGTRGARADTGERAGTREHAHSAGCTTQCAPALAPSVVARSQLARCATAARSAAPRLRPQSPEFDPFPARPMAQKLFDASSDFYLNGAPLRRPRSFLPPACPLAVVADDAVSHRPLPPPSCALPARWQPPRLAGLPHRAALRWLTHDALAAEGCDALRACARRVRRHPDLGPRVVDAAQPYRGAW